MNKLILSFLSKNDSPLIEISNNIECQKLYLDILLSFENINLNNNVMEGNGLQIKSVKLEENINLLVSKYSFKLPSLNKLSKFIRNLNQNEYFFIFPYKINSIKTKMEMFNFLEVINNGGKFDQEKFNDINKKGMLLFDTLLNTYEIITVNTNKRSYIGESNKLNRICRFCNNTNGFNKVAHAISEAFGNKNIILRDECDNCNEFFDKNIERDFINYLDFYRVFFNVKGKNGTPKIKYKNGFIENKNGIINISYKEDKIEAKFNEPPQKIVLESLDSITPINIYKTLTKFALSIIDKKYLKYFDNTIKWITTTVHNDIKLPKVALLNEPKLFVEHPQIFLYLRKENNAKFPFLVAEFKFCSLVFAYIVPFSSKDQIDFSEENEFTKMWSIFKNYNKTNGWNFYDFSDSKSYKYPFHLNLKQRKNTNQ